MLSTHHLISHNPFQAAEALESRIKKMTGIYTSGVGTLKELANTLHMKASSDMEQIQSKISSQTSAVESVSEENDCFSMFHCKPWLSREF